MVPGECSSATSCFSVTSSSHLSAEVVDCRLLPLVSVVVLSSSLCPYQSLVAPFASRWRMRHLLLLLLHPLLDDGPIPASQESHRRLNRRLFVVPLVPWSQLLKSSWCVLVLAVWKSDVYYLQVGQFLWGLLSGTTEPKAKGPDLCQGSSPFCSFPTFNNVRLAFESSFVDEKTSSFCLSDGYMSLQFRRS